MKDGHKIIRWTVLVDSKDIYTSLSEEQIMLLI